ncbi:hypothetical protein AYL99_03911 [Fonsecaea erecta]|uniref:Alpha/beta hydrolase fold-3 domain-containing protein n=1 Tax=Fonsecaea erecta TaxID=1367422 RepID=A0A178ZPF7_9EURO|nr:hypothetical protein AYL99_03911 [Fonsecaea erecta]OAP61708.1 hypothetical protein AYL99_03911 [Fonsecaea erecta]
MPTTEFKYAWLSQMDPVWEPIQAECDARFRIFWDLPPEQYQEAWKSAPLVMPEGTPMDLEVTFTTIPLRDGYEAELKIYRNVERLKAMSGGSYEGEGEKQKSAAAGAPLMLVAHGGGWMMGDHAVEEGVCRYTAKETGAVVVSVNYRLAPKYRFPQGLNDYYDAFKWCKANASTLGINPSMIITCGSSAGGNLAAVLPIMARDQNEGGIIGQLLNSPVLCHPKYFPRDKGYEYNSFQQNKNSSILGEQNMLNCWAEYYPNTGPDVYANPLLVDSVKGLPPALIQISGLDPLRDEEFAYADRLREAGIPVDIEVFPGLPHGFYTFPQLEATTKYFKKSAAWVKKLLASKGWDA